MLTVYIVTGVVGLALALLAVVAADHEHDADLDAGGDLDQAFDQGAEGDAHLWLPFLSLRFWTYAFAGFGLTGTLLTLFTRTASPTILALAFAMGLTAGTMIAVTVRLAQKQEATSGAGTRDMLGLEANVLVAIRPGQPGKVRLQAKGDIIDMIAVSAENSVIEAGSKALVVGVEGDRASVVTLETLEGENLLTSS